MLNYVNSEKDTTEWFGVSDLKKDGIEDAIKDLNNGKGILHEHVMGKMKNKYTHA